MRAFKYIDLETKKKEIGTLKISDIESLADTIAEIDLEQVALQQSISSLQSNQIKYNKIIYNTNANWVGSGAIGFSNTQLGFPESTILRDKILHITLLIQRAGITEYDIIPVNSILLYYNSIAIEVAPSMALLNDKLILNITYID